MWLLGNWAPAVRPALAVHAAPPWVHTALQPALPRKAQLRTVGRAPPDTVPRFLALRRGCVFFFLQTEGETVHQQRDH